MDHRHIQSALNAYLASFPADEERTAPIQRVLDSGEDDVLISRKSPGHATTGAIVVDPSRRTVLQLRHRQLDRWLLPGGHVEPSDPSLPEAARRELIEEAGELGRQAALVLEEPLDVDVHPIPPRPERQEEEHLHFDFRFLFTTSDKEVTLALDEVTDFRWTPLATLDRLGERVEAALAAR